ncbi:hypothetical protein AB0J21_11685 [Streptomyces sp. NPDC049954]|uniref:hypothetical protein n=1 Tax=Streptomyces sp. NPDC049954 TaxID=3155779 RepID=UPI003430F635
MKFVKTAALVAGTLAAAGAAGPAFAAGELTPGSVNGGLNSVVEQGQGALGTVASDALDPNVPDSAGHTLEPVVGKLTPLAPKEKLNARDVLTGKVLADLTDRAGTQLLSDEQAGAPLGQLLGDERGAGPAGQLLGGLPLGALPLGR